MSEDHVLYDVKDHIATITLNRPDKLNAVTFPMLARLTRLIDEVDSNDDVRAVVFTGAGKAFSVGADLSAGPGAFDYAKEDPELVNPDGTTNYAHPRVRDTGGLLTLRLFRCNKPLIAAINGTAAGVGATMTLPMDVRFASTAAKFAFVFVRRGIVPEAASTWFLPRVVGIAAAADWCLSGRVIPLEEAAKTPLIKQICTPEDLLPAAYDYAREIAEKAAPVSVALTRHMLWRGLGFSHPMESHKLDSRAVMARGSGPDVREGVNSFLEKRAAHFPQNVSNEMPDFFPWWREPEYK